MPVANEVQNYRVSIFAGAPADGKRIGIQLTGTDAIGQFEFVENAPLAPAMILTISVGPFTHFVRAVLPVSAYAAAIDLLRHEKPVHFGCEDDGRAWIGTGSEPVGEGES
jgi:hypothetical protein